MADVDEAAAAAAGARGTLAGLAKPLRVYTREMALVLVVFSVMRW